MKKLAAAILLLLTISACTSLSAQSLSLTAGSEPVRSLDGPWRFHTGDNPAWADPNFDDSSWDSMDLKPMPGAVAPYKGTRNFVPGWTVRGYPGYSGYAWYRLRLKLYEIAPNPGPGANDDLGLLMPENVDDAYQVYVNGRLIGEFGRFTAHGVIHYISKAQAFPLPDGSTNLSGGSVVIAIRMWMAPFTPLTIPDAGGLHEAPVIGQAATIHDLLLLDRDALDRVLASYFLEIAILILALLVAFGLYGLDRTDPANFWLGLIWLANLVSSILWIMANNTTWLGGPSPFIIQDAILGPTVIGLWVIFWGYWFRLDMISHLHRIVWAMVLLLAVGTAMLRAPLYGGLVPVHAEVWLLPFTDLCKMLLGALVVWVTYRGIRKEPTEGWLALPAVVLVVISLYQEPLLVLHVPTYFYPFRIGVSLDQIAIMLSLGVITLLLLRRFLKGQRQREQWKMEIEQARQVQSLLIPTSTPETPGLAIESEYRPAREVGGDFFHIQPADDGSLLIICGDVSGKGLKAAMTVSTIIGALRNEPSRQPATVLANLNRLLHGNISGFAVCTAALIHADGSMTLANAGNLAPYLNGKELPVEPGLPLGVTAESAYAESALQLNPSDRLAFISDGVVEATNPRRELFGFDRTQAISNQTAGAIADAAQAFGQQDDISVIAITVAPALKEALA